MTFPYFDPADFATVSPSPSFASASTSSSAPWVDASSSPYSSSSAIALQASSSQTSLWTASSASDNEEQRCLDLLDQLEAEVTKLGGDGEKARKRASRIVGGRIAFPLEQGDVFGQFGALGAQSFLYVFRFRVPRSPSTRLTETSLPQDGCIGRGRLSRLALDEVDGNAPSRPFARQQYAVPPLSPHVIHADRPRRARH